MDGGTDQHAKSYNISLVKLTDTQTWMNFFTQITTKLKFYPNSLCSLNTVLTLLTLLWIMKTWVKTLSNAQNNTSC